MDSFTPLYHQRAMFLFKLLDEYLDQSNTALPLMSEVSGASVLPVMLRKDVQKPIADFLRTTLHCRVTFGKDRYGQPNGYLMISLDNDRLNQTGFYNASLALQKFKTTSYV